MAKILEKQIVREICDWLYEQKYFFWRQNNVPIFQRDNYGARFRALPKYTPRGLPDILVLFRGRLVGLEVKTPTYWKRTDDQIKIQDNFLNNGAEYQIVTSLEEAKNFMNEVHVKIDIKPLLAM